MKKRENFSRLASVKLNVSKQGLIFYINRNYYRFSEKKQQLLDRQYERIGGEYANALRRYMLTADTMTKICFEEHIASPSTIYPLVRRFYEEFPLGEFLR
ncbi:MAG: hypothetical protein HFE63_01420 [Clostridiales bacterium]|nr:hypothetical protein [Clostridiales bacterium]